MKTNLFRKNMLPLLGRGLGRGFLLLWGLGGGGVLLAQTPNLPVCADKGYTIKTNKEASGKDVTYKWYEKADDGEFGVVESETSSSFKVAAKNSAGTYAYVRMAFSEDCEGGVASNTFTVVVLKPEKPTVTVSEAAACAGAGDLTFTVAPADNTTYTWTWSGTEGTPTGDDNSTYTVSGAAYGTKSVQAAASVTYQIGALNPKTCVSAFSDVASAIVNPLPEITNVTTPDLCGGGVKALAVTVAAGTATVTETATIKWYAEDNTSSDQLETGATYSPTLTASKTYYVGAAVTANAITCPSASLTPVTATINLYEGVIEGTEDSD